MTSFNEMCYIIAKRSFSAVISQGLLSLHGIDFKFALGAVNYNYITLKERMNVKQYNIKKQKHALNMLGYKV